MRKMFLVCVMMMSCVMMSGIALGAEAERGQAAPAIKWDQPMTYEDGTPMVQGDIESFEMHYAIDAAFAEMAKPVVMKPDQRAYEFNLKLPPKLVPYTVSIGLKTKTIYGTWSKMSNVVVSTFKVTSTKTPSAPVNLRFSITCDSTCRITDQKIETVQ